MRDITHDIYPSRHKTVTLSLTFSLPWTYFMDGKRAGVFLGNIAGNRCRLDANQLHCKKPAKRPFSVIVRFDQCTFYVHCTMYTNLYIIIIEIGRAKYN